MTYLTQQLVTRAYYLSGIVARDYQFTSGTQISDGIFLLNEFLSIKSADTGLIPYFTRTDIRLVTGEEKYFIPNLVDLEMIVFYLSNVRFEMENRSRYNYFGISRADHVTSLPLTWHAERVKDGTDIYFYFLPDKNYPITFTGKYQLTQTALNMDLEQFYDKYMLSYFRYGLASYLCQEDGIATPPEVAQEILNFENKLRYVSPMDLTMRKKEYFKSGPGYDFPDVALAPVWRPS